MIDNWCTVIGVGMHACNMRILVLTGKLTHTAEAACNIVGGCYKYIGDLRLMEALTGDIAAAACHPHHSPLILPAWQSALASHPDPEFRDYIHHGHEYGFHIGFDRGACSLRAARSNIWAHARLTLSRWTTTYGRNGPLASPIPRALARFCHYTKATPTRSMVAYSEPIISTRAQC